MNGNETTATQHAHHDPKPEEEKVGQDLVQALLRSNGDGWDPEGKARDEKLQKLAVAMAAVEYLMNKLELHVSNHGIFQELGIVHVGIHSGDFRVESFQQLHTFFPQLGSAKAV